ncbi:MAG: pantoate--beta-alanine ligase [Verrucomicrobiota bacterium]
MKCVASAKSLQRTLLALKKDGKRIGFIPTMGALHEGHLSLIDVARKHSDYVVMSIYVNPTQFGPKEDFKKYPRPQKVDQNLARRHGVDLLFSPGSLYAADESVRVTENKISKGRCGASREGHFDGVVTVVSKLFNIVQPDIAVFGQKDAQQVEVIERLVRDLYFPIKIVRAPIIRDAKGLALSSRNRYLSTREYNTAIEYAGVFNEECHSRKPVPTIKRNLKRRLSKIKGLKIDYLEISNKWAYVAVVIGKTRLIDNRQIR